MAATGANMPSSPIGMIIQHLRKIGVRQVDNVSDGQLLERFCVQGEQAAFEALLRRHGAMVLGVCQRILHNAHDAEDAFQATFLVLVRKARSLLARKTVGNWLHEVASRTAFNARRAACKRRAKEKQVKTTSQDQPDEVWRELQPLLDQELQRLPDKYRVPIILCDLEGKTRKEAARHLGWPEGTVSGRLSRGRALLARRLSRHGLAVSGGVLAAALCQNVASACVPGPLVVSTVQAATLMAAGKALATGAISAKVVALTEGVLKAMLMTKLKVAFAVVLAVHLIGAGVGLVYCQTAGSGQDKGGGPPAAQEKADKPVPTDQQPAPKKEAKEEAKAGQPIDYQKMAQEARWKQPETDNNPWTMSVLADGKKGYEWPWGMPSTFFIEANGVIYHALFSHAGPDCEVVAYDLKAGKVLWRTKLKGVNEVLQHSEYSNRVRLERVNGEVLAVYGEEMGYHRYVEIVDMKTGKTVGHKVFSRKQPEPKKEAPEEQARKIDYQKMAQEARWKPPETDDNRWTMSVSTDGKKVYDWRVVAPSTFFVDSNCVVYHAVFVRSACGCEVVAYDLKVRKELWRTDLKGVGRGIHDEYWNMVRLERVNNEVLAVYGEETGGVPKRYIEIVDMKTGKTVGHKVFPKKDADKKPGAKANPPEDDPAVKLKKDAKDDDKKDDGADPKAAAGAPPAKTDAPKPLPEDIVAAWKEAGAVVGWLRPSPANSLCVMYVGEKEGKPGDLPAFLFRSTLGEVPEREPRKHIDVMPGPATPGNDLDHLLAKLPAPTQPFGLWLLGTPVTDAGLKELARLNSLQALVLRMTPVTDVGVKELAGLKSLQALDLNYTKVTDAGLKELAGLKSLQALDLGLTKVTDVGVKELAGLKSLQTLNLCYTKVTDAGLKELAGLKSLQALDLGWTQVTDAGLKELAGLKSLKTLNLCYTKVTDAGLKELAGLKNLQSLNLANTPVTDAGLKELAGLKNLQSLELSTTKVTHTGLKELAGLKSLQWLNLGGTKVTNAGLKELAGLNSLQALYLDSTQVTDAGLKELAGLKNLQWLGVGTAQITDAGLKELAGLKNLQWLSIVGTKVTDAGLKEFERALPGCKITSKPVQVAPPPVAPRVAPVDVEKSR